MEDGIKWVLAVLSSSCLAKEPNGGSRDCRVVMPVGEPAQNFQPMTTSALSHKTESLNPCGLQLHPKLCIQNPLDCQAATTSDANP